MSGETDRASRRIPAIPGAKEPQELPPADEPAVERVPDAEQPDSDDEGHMAPPLDP